MWLSPALLNKTSSCCLEQCVVTTTRHLVKKRKPNNPPKLQNFALPFTNRFFSSGSNYLPMSAGKRRCSGFACIYLLPKINRRYFWEANIRGCKKMTLAYSKIKASFFKSWAVVVVISHYSIAVLLPGLMCPGCML